MPPTPPPRASAGALAAARRALASVLTTRGPRSVSGYQLFGTEMRKQGGLPAGGPDSLAAIAQAWQNTTAAQKDAYNQQAKSAPPSGGGAQQLTIRSEGTMKSVSTAVAAAVLKGFAQDLTSGAPVSVAGVGRFTAKEYTPKGAKNPKFEIAFSPSVSRPSK